MAKHSHIVYVLLFPVPSPRSNLSPILAQTKKNKNTLETPNRQTAREVI